MAKLTSKLAHELLSTLDEIWEENFKNQPQPPYRTLSGNGNDNA